MAVGIPSTLGVTSRFEREGVVQAVLHWHISDHTSPSPPQTSFGTIYYATMSTLVRFETREGRPRTDPCDPCHIRAGGDRRLMYYPWTVRGSFTPALPDRAADAVSRGGPGRYALWCGGETSHSGWMEHDDCTFQLGWVSALARGRLRSPSPGFAGIVVLAVQYECAPSRACANSCPTRRRPALNRRNVEMACAGGDYFKGGDESSNSLQSVCPLDDSVHPRQSTGLAVRRHQTDTGFAGFILRARGEVDNVHGFECLGSSTPEHWCRRRAMCCWRSARLTYPTTKLRRERTLVDSIFRISNNYGSWDPEESRRTFRVGIMISTDQDTSESPTRHCGSVRHVLASTSTPGITRLDDAGGVTPLTRTAPAAPQRSVWKAPESMRKHRRAA
ncbi:hypothetical protein B0H10DRAFT_2187350 [Mycena sp. CBHHK59/15]|nr:hypothetical protein B0H10DRAFT_2187350 [Mycena sp. CBHHK59/15]